MMAKIFGMMDRARRMYANLVLVLVLLSMLTSCAGVQMAPSEVGQVYALQLGSTQWGLARAAKGAFDTFVMTDGNGHYFFSWAINDAWAFLTCEWAGGACSSADLVSKANIVNATTMGDFVKWLEEHGWKFISASELPALLAQAAAVMPTFIIVPVDGAWKLEEYQDWKGEEWW